MITKREINITSFHKLLCNMTQARVFICLNINSKTGPVFLFSPAFNIENVNFITTYLHNYLHNVSIWCISVVKQRWTNLLVLWCFGLYFLLLCIVISVANLFTKTNGKTQSHPIGQNFITRKYMVNKKKINILLFWVFIYCAEHRVYFDIDEHMLVHDVYQSLVYILAIRNHTWMQMYACVLVWGLWLSEMLVCTFCMFLVNSLAFNDNSNINTHKCTVI